MLFKYKATTSEGEVKEGDLEAASMEIALDSLQRRNLIVVSLDPAHKKGFWGGGELFSSGRVKKKDVVIFSRQLSTLFEARVPVLTSFKMLAAETEGVALRKIIDIIVKDIESGDNISRAMSKHPKVFSIFYVNMVKAGEESGKLDEIFHYLADYLERNSDITSKATRALVYPAFVISAFIGVMVLMMVFVVPKMIEIIEESEQEMPFYTKIVMGVSDFLVNYGVFLLIALAVSAFLLWRYSRTKAGQLAFSKFQITVPLLGGLYKKLYISRISDNLETLISGGVSMLRSLEITSDTIENSVYKALLFDTKEAVKSGSTISESFYRSQYVPHLVTQMIRIGEETGKLDFILKTLAKFYRKEVDASVDTLISLIEPVMIIVLGGGVGVLLASILLPIYNIALSV
ncbi:type II secretion system F family protein [Patescibacteria group bacterium]|nr:type II secretion system F family protein [Patescibacteria group bacterium]MBU2633181.1 type II secretion system F family protein [Patescibacteria group bacterium]